MAMQLQHYKINVFVGNVSQRTAKNKHHGTCSNTVLRIVGDSRSRCSAALIECACVWIVLDHSVSTHKDG